LLGRDSRDGLDYVVVDIKTTSTTAELVLTDATVRCAVPWCAVLSCDVK
jgi:hypothetical protein